MNYILGLIFLVFILFYYNILGNLIINFVDAKYTKLSSFKILTGFIFCYFISFIIGLPCQFFKVNWNIFFYSMLIANIILFFYSFKHTFKDLNGFFKFINKKLNKKSIIEWLKNNWVCLVFVIVFMFFSLSNVMALYQLNYDDTYYISKIVNSIGTPALQNENFYNGMLVNQSDIDLGRILNTYEISYGFWASLFHIKVSFFCRLVMNLHNYIIFVIVIKNLASLFLKENKCQYVILPFFIFLISSGYLMEANQNYHIRIYDLWQFQTAMWYGGSIVRTLTIPVMFLYALPLLLDKIRIKPFLTITAVSITMLSFSSVALPMVVVLFFVLYILKFVINIKYAISKKDKKNLFISILGLIIMICLLLLTKKLDHTLLLKPEVLDLFKDAIAPFKVHYVDTDMIYKYSCIILFIAFITLLKNRGIVFIIFIVLLNLIVPTGYFYELLSMTSFNFFFVVLRFFSAIQFMIIFLLGLIIIKILSKLNKNTVNNILSLTMIISVLAFIVTNYSTIVKYDFLGSGINKDGYNIQDTIKNEAMIPDIYNNVGEYFNTLPYENYTLLAPAEFTIDEHNIVYNGFVMASNRIQIISRTDNEEDNKNYDIVNSYLNDKLSYNQAKDAFNYFDNAYILTFSKKQVNELKASGAKQVYNQDNYYLMKLN